MSKKRFFTLVIAILAISFAAMSVSAQSIAGWPPADILSSYGLNGLTQPAGTTVDFEIESPRSIMIKLKDATEAHASAVVAQIQKIPDIMAAPMFENSLNTGAIEGRFFLGISDDRYWEYDVKYYANQKSFTIYVRQLRG